MIFAQMVLPVDQAIQVYLPMGQVVVMLEVVQVPNPVRVQVGVVGSAS